MWGRMGGFRRFPAFPSEENTEARFSRLWRSSITSLDKVKAELEFFGGLTAQKSQLDALLNQLTRQWPFKAKLPHWMVEDCWERSHLEKGFILTSVSRSKKTQSSPTSVGRTPAWSP